MQDLIRTFTKDTILMPTDNAWFDALYILKAKIPGDLEDDPFVFNITLLHIVPDVLIRTRELTVGKALTGQSLLGYEVQFLRTADDRVQVSVVGVEGSTAFVLMSDRSYTAKAMMLTWLTSHVGADVAAEMVSQLSATAAGAPIADVGNDK
ncbi:hypothetical protein PLESTB_000711900 [Pleodorina starrii]|uniref:Uncharacterized protein n=1 Tax=Pleodorina starrii TaxID=330485 RepID=A0A9W6BJV8_9CHLO|nr:hypothetical protein PLESTB_000056000 [Pleodorina starrii]GLC53135.1 hypothetical protein PLESTB_000711900 [Pleodorina starrii]GLC68074.1 hypothetical protein PLESTF_000643300 [Pleodorina starrii]